MEKVIDDKIDELEAFVNEKIIEKNEIPLFSKDDYTVSLKLSKRYLEEEIPIGSYLEDDILLQFQSVNFNDIEETKELEDIIASLDEKVVTVSILSNAFQIVKLEDLIELEKQVSKNIENKEELHVLLKENYAEKVKKRDELFLKSLEIIEVYNYYKQKDGG